jgi:transposase-like protein
MPWKFHKIDPLIKTEILRQVKEEFLPAVDVAAKYGISSKTIYNWLKTEVEWTGKTDSQYLTEIHKLQRERDELVQIVWAFSIVVERLKKKDEEDRFNTRYPGGRKK